MNMFQRYVNGINVSGVVVLGCMLGLWETSMHAGWLDLDYLPLPSNIAMAFWTLCMSGEMFTNTIHTLRSVLIGWGVATVIGLSCGLAVGLSSTLRRFSWATIEVLRPLPGIAFLPVAIMLFNFSIETELAIIIYPTVWPILVAAMTGVSVVHSRLFDVSKTLRLSRYKTIFSVILPAITPALMTGCRVGFSIALIMAVIAEMLGNPMGLGHAIINAQLSMQSENMFAYVLMIGVLGIMLNASLMATVQSLPFSKSATMQSAKPTQSNSNRLSKGPSHA